MNEGKLSLRLAAEQPKIKVIYVGTYIPRECGIATFTKDLTNAINILNPTYLADIVAIDDQIGSVSKGYDYPWEVKFKIKQDDLASWLAAADYINQSAADVVNLQHEFGIYGTRHGNYAIPFMERLKKPVVTTMHTVLPEPTDEWKQMVRRIAELSSAVVVMVNTAVTRLVEDYGIDPEKIVVIPHGVPDVPFTPSEEKKPSFRLRNQNVIMSFGLVSPGKGYEYAIQAMPSVLAKHPNTKLLLLGETHPVVLKKEGEAYRQSLRKLVRELKLSSHVRFVNNYLSLEEIINYLMATDVYLTAYPNLNQITSGTLAYAIGTGRACISTPYLYAQEVFEDERGILIKPNDAKSLAKGINYLLDHPKKRQEMMQRAYAFGRSMIWPSVALKYLDLFDFVRN